MFVAFETCKFGCCEELGCMEVTGVFVVVLTCGVGCCKDVGCMDVTGACAAAAAYDVGCCEEEGSMDDDIIMFVADDTGVFVAVKTCDIGC